MELGSGRRKRATVGVEVAGKSHTIERGGKGEEDWRRPWEGSERDLEGSEKCFSPSSPLFPCLSSEPGGRVGAGEGGEGGRRRCRRRNGWVLEIVALDAWGPSRPTRTSGGESPIATDVQGNSPSLLRLS